MRRLTVSTVLGALLALAGCDDDDVDPDAGPRVDAGPGVDAGDFDAGSPPPDPCETSGPPELGVEPVGAFARPIYVTSAPGDSGALYVVEQEGRVVRRAPDGSTRPFVEVEVNCCAGGADERGLLGLAFHPDYEANGRFFLYYTSPGKNRVGEYRRSADDPTVADPDEVARLVDQDDFAGNHNGGMLQFGPDGFLYVAMGDGGGGGDPERHGLNTETLLGAILRLDVDNAPSYAAAGNPFEGGGGAPQIWAYGLRNPWRFSFDRLTGDLWIGDVGQGAWEEIDMQPAGSPGGQNYGWRAYEGTRPYEGATDEDLAAAANHTPPLYEYDHGGGRCSVTGGFVYRGASIEGLEGYYLFADYCSAQVWALRTCGDEVQTPEVLDSAATGIGFVTGFGEDEDGELYLTGAGGQIVRVVAR